MLAGGADMRGNQKEQSERQAGASSDLPALVHHPQIHTHKGSLTEDAVTGFVGRAAIDQELGFDDGRVFGSIFHRQIPLVQPDVIHTACHIETETHDADKIDQHLHGLPAGY